MTPPQTRIAKLAFAIGDAFPDAPVTLERAHHVTWVLITLRKNRVAVRWNSERPQPGFEINTPESYYRCGYMQTTAHADSPREVVECLKIYAAKGFKALFGRELNRRIADHEANPGKGYTLAQMRSFLTRRIRRARPYVDVVPPSLKKVVEMTPAQLRKLRAM